MPSHAQIFLAHRPEFSSPEIGVQKPSNIHYSVQSAVCAVVVVDLTAVVECVKCVASYALCTLTSFLACSQELTGLQKQDISLVAT